MRLHRFAIVTAVFGLTACGGENPPNRGFDPNSTDGGPTADGGSGDAGTTNDGGASDGGTANDGGPATDGGSPPPPPPAKVLLQLQTNGAGLVQGSGADCRGSCGVSYDAGATVHLVAVADSGNGFVGWGGACAGSDTHCDLTLSANQTVIANFGPLPPPPPRTHTLTVSLDGQGRVTSSPAGMDCSGATCTADFSSGATVMLAAAAANGWTFAGWSGACSGTGGCVVSLANDAQVGAKFNAPPPPPANAHVTVAVKGPGRVTGAGLSCGNGASTCDVTVPAGSTQTLQASANTQARFIGWSGACSGSDATCTLTANGEVSVTAKFSYILTTLVANDSYNDAARLALNSTDVFFFRNTNNGTALFAVSKDGGEPRRVASGTGYTLATDDNGYVYWTDNYSIYSAPVGGGSADVIFSGANGIGRLSAGADGALYFTSNTWRQYEQKASVHRLQDRVDTVLVDNTYASPASAVDETYVYFGSFDYRAQVGALKRVRKSGGTPETVIECGCEITALKTDFDNIYVRSSRGDVWAVSKAHPALRLLSGSNGNARGYHNGFTEIYSNASVVYWNWTEYQTTMGIFAARADGSGWTAIDTGQDSNWYCPRVDDTAIYYWHAGALLKRLK